MTNVKKLVTTAEYELNDAQQEIVDDLLTLLNYARRGQIQTLVVGVGVVDGADMETSVMTKTVDDVDGSPRCGTLRGIGLTSALAHRELHNLHDTPAMPDPEFVPPPTSEE